MISFVLGQTDHGAIILNRNDWNVSIGGQRYGVGAQLMDTGTFDGAEIIMLRELLPVRRHYHGDGVVAVDGGANIGLHALGWGRTMREWGNVIAIEAQPRIYYALCGNVALHNLWNVQCLNAAVSDQEDWLHMPEPDYSKPGSFGSFELRRRLGTENIGQPINYDKPTVMVQQLRIDNLGLERLDLLKLDVEGMELEALEGAADTIMRCHPILFIEAIKVDKKELVDILRLADYRIFPHGMSLLAIHEADKTIDNVHPVPVPRKEEM